jgi:hypothetical protein
VRATTWGEIEQESGLDRAEMRDAARVYMARMP